MDHKMSSTKQNFTYSQLEEPGDRIVRTVPQTVNQPSIIDRKLRPCTVLVAVLSFCGALVLMSMQLLQIDVAPYDPRHQQNAVPLLRSPSFSAPGKVVSCYYNFPSQNASNQLMPRDIHSHLCTHINVGFATVFQKEIKLEYYQYNTLRDLNKLKIQNPDLKILLSVGGAHGDTGFSDMVIDHASRKTFIKSIKSILRNYSLDGVDLDWEFPALHSARSGGRERQHFSQLLREIRMEYIREKRDYMLTLATAAPETIVDVSYDIDQINEYVDYVNIMTYDFHYYTKYTPFTGLNSPLYARPSERLFLATLNVNYTVQMYRSRGLGADKIVVGIPTYGHTFTLVNADNAQIGSPAAGAGAGSAGFIDYPAVCRLLRAPGVRVRFEPAARVPFLWRADQWVSFDSARSVADKARFVRQSGLRGAMLYSLNADDYRGECVSAAGRDFPLLRSVRDTLLGE